MRITLVTFGVVFLVALPVVLSQGCKFKADIAFLLDGSGSVRATNFLKMQNFLEKVVLKYTVGPDDVLFAAVLYSSRSKVMFDFTQHTSTNSVLKAIKAISYPRGTTHTDLGLNDIRTKIFTAAGGHRAGIPQVLIVMTDGNAYNAAWVKREADLVKDKGITVFSIGIGSSISNVQLQAIASDSSKVIRATNFDELVKFIASLAQETCKAAEATKKDTVTSSVKFTGDDVGVKVQNADFVVSKVFGKVIILNGINSYVTVPRADIDQSSFTISVYIKVDRFNKDQAIVGNWGPEANERQYLLAITKENKVRLYLNFKVSGRYVTEFVEGGDVAESGKDGWQVIVVTWDMNRRKASIYLNGALVGERTMTQVTIATGSSQTNEVGSVVKNGGLHFSGAIARLTIYNYALTVDYVKTFNKKIESATSSDVEVPVVCTTKFRADIAILLDGSGSVLEENFLKMLDFVERVVTKYTVGPDDVLFSAVLYSSSSRVMFDFTKYTSTNTLLKAFKAIRYPRGTTRTDLGLNDIRTKIFTAAGGHRAGIPQVLIVMTDGNANNAALTKREADLVKDEGINVFSIGIGKKISDEQLEAIASDSSKVFHVSDFDELFTFIGTLAKQTCKAADDSTKNKRKCGCVLHHLIMGNDGHCFSGLSCYQPRCENLPGERSGKCPTGISSSPLANGFSMTSIFNFAGDDVGVKAQNAKYEFSQVFGRVLVLNGINSYVTVPRADVDQSSFTISVYIKVDRFNKDQAIVGNWGSEANERQYLLAITKENKVRLYLNFKVSGRYVTEFVEGGDVAGDKKFGWQVIVVTWNKNQRKAVIYLNGELVGEKNLSQFTIVSGSSPTNEVGGVTKLGGLRFSGEIARLAIYNYELTVDYVKTFNKKIDTEVSSDVDGGEAPVVCKFRADIAFLLDGSGSVLEENFFKMLDFVDEVVTKYTVGPDDVLFSAVLYSSRSKVMFDFNKYTTKNELLKAVKSISYPTGSTATHLGLNDIRTKIFTAAGGHRAGIPQVLIVMTDGNANDAARTKKEVDLVKDEGINVFSIGIGKKIAEGQLQELASDSSKVFRVENFDQLVNFIGTLAEKTCRAAEATKKDTLISTWKFDGTDKGITTNIVKHVTSRLFGKVFILSGSNSYVTVPRPEIAQSSFTFSVYVKVNKFDKKQVIIGDWGKTEDTQKYLLLITNKNTIQLLFHFLENGKDEFGGLEGGDVAGPNKDGWQVIVVTWDRTTGKAVIYLNGDVVAEKVFRLKTLYPTTSTTNQVGNLPGLDDIYFEGKIARVSIYNYALAMDYVWTFNKLAEITTMAPTTTTTTTTTTTVTPAVPNFDVVTDKPAQKKTYTVYFSTPTDFPGPLNIVIYGSSGVCSDMRIGRIAGNNVVNKFDLRCPDVGTIKKIQITNKANTDFTITLFRVYDDSSSTNLNVITSKYTLQVNQRITATVTINKVPIENTVAPVVTEEVKSIDPPQEPDEIPQKEKVGGQDEKVDLVFAIENTGNMDVYRLVVRYVLSRYHLSSGGVRVGIHTFGGKATEVVPLEDEPQSDRDILDELESIPTSSSQTVDIVVALQHLVEQFKSGRADAQKVLVLVGQFSSNAGEAQVVGQLILELKKLNVNVIVFIYKSSTTSALAKALTGGGSTVISFSHIMQIRAHIEQISHIIHTTYKMWQTTYKTITTYVYSCSDPKQPGKVFKENEKWNSGCVVYQCKANREARQAYGEILDIKCADAYGQCKMPGETLSFKHQGKVYNGCTCSIKKNGKRHTTSYSC